MSKKYRLINHGERYEFEIMAFEGSDDFLLKDLHTLEKYYFKGLLQYGKGEDYLLEEIVSDN